MPPRNHIELDALLARELMPVLERLAREHQVMAISVCAIEQSDVSSAISTCTRRQDARALLEKALEAHQIDDTFSQDC